MTLPSLAGIEDALAIVRPHLPETPLVRSELLSQAFAAEVWLKNETVSPIASFKLRGALTCMSRAKARGRLKGACAASTGNHGQGVALAARLLGTTADIFLPAAANPVKAAMIEAFGARLHKLGRDGEEAKDAAKALARERGLLFVDDGDDLDVMEGAATVGLEIARRLERIDRVFVPVGAANLISGVAAAIKAIQPGARAIGVQSKRAPAVVESYLAKRPVERACDTIADGLAERVPPMLAHKAMMALVDDAFLVSDEALLAGVRTTAECAHALVEPAGAAALAGAWERRGELAGKRVVLVLSGANLTMDLLRRAIDSPPLFTLDSLGRSAR